MRKKTALGLFTFCDLIALLVLWLGYDVINNVISGIVNSADNVSINNRIGFFIFGIGIPIVHIFALCDYLFLHKFFKKNAAWVNGAFVILGIVLFASAFFLSAYMRTYVEEAGYLRCPEADKRMTFTTYLMYTKNYDICSRLVERDKKNRADRQ